MKKITSVILSLVLILSNLLIVNMLIAPIGANNFVAAFPGGNGTPGNPYQVGNVTDLQNMSSNLSANYILINDIDCSVTSGWNGGLGFSPIANDTNKVSIGFQGPTFTGSLEGQGYSIINLTIDRSGEDYVGLFGYIDTVAVIKNVSIINYDITGLWNAGGLAGHSNSGTVTNIYTDGNVSGSSNKWYVGGIIGYNAGVVTDCIAFGNSTGSDYIGGLIGYNTGTVTDCISYANSDSWDDFSGSLIGYNTGTVTSCIAYGTANSQGFSSGYTGSLIGWSAGGTVESCTAYGTATGYDRVGGLVGLFSGGGIIANSTSFGDAIASDDESGGLIGSMSSGIVTGCTAFGNATGVDSVGGLIGFGQFGSMNNCSAYGKVTGTGNADYIGGLVGWKFNGGSITNCLSHSDVTGDDYVGGLVGLNTGTVTNCYSKGLVTGNTNVGGLIGNTSIAVTASFWDNITSNQTTSDGGAGVVGKNTTVMMRMSTFTNVSWDFDLVGDGTIDTWIMAGYPHLQIEHRAEIWTDWQLELMKVDLTVDYMMIDDIDASETSIWNDSLGFSPVGNDTNPVVFGKQGDNFTGSFDGNGYIIINLTINRSSEDYVGLFGYADAGVEIENVHLENNNITGDEYVGGLIGYNGGTVTNCTVQGNTTGNDYAGGLIGRNQGTTVSNCHVVGNVDGTQYSGGLIGLNVGSVTDCTATGNTTGADMTGGLIGETWVSISNCYSIGNVSGNDNTGGLIGQNEAGTITNCSSQGSATGIARVGGLIGYNKGEIVINCTANVTTNGTSSYVGGLIGHNTDGPLTNCHAYGDVNGTEGLVGGLIGYNQQNSPLTNCTAHGDVKGILMFVGGLLGANGGPVTNCTSWGDSTVYGDRVGGLIGENEGDVINCTAFGNATGDGSNSDFIGGLIGRNLATGILIDCTAYGTANGTNDAIGGLIGENSGTVTNCTSYGDATGAGASSGQVGGLIGLANAGTVTNCTAYGYTRGTDNNVGGLIGQNGGTVTNCVAYGTANSTVLNVGGLFGYHTGIVTNSVAWGDAISLTNFIGGLIGTNDATVTNCTSYGNAIGNGGGSDYVGGLIGESWGPVSFCTAYGSSNGTGDYIGGLIGNNEGASVTNCSAYGDADGAGGNSQYTGGLLGWNEGGTVTNCGAYGNASGTGWEVGGLIAENAAGSVVTNSHAYGDVNGWRLNGGLIAYNSGTVSNCTASGTVIGTEDYQGGLIGYTDGGSIKDCIAYASVNGTGASSKYVGGLIGQISGSVPVTNCTAYGDATGNGDWIGGLIGDNSGGSVTDCTAYGNATGPTDEVGGLIGESSVAGSVINCIAYGNAYGDNDVGGLIGMSFGLVSKCTAYGDATGTADGLGGLIGWNYGDVDNSTSYGDAIGIGIDSGEVGGLMGYNDVKTVENCVSYGSASALTEHIGGLIGENKGTVTNCIAYGSATGATDWIGGLIGVNTGGTITVCAAFGDAIGNSTGHDYVGGLIGDNSGGSVENCYSQGDVTGNVSVGGLIGYNDGSVNASYSIGFIIGDTDVGGLIGLNSSSSSVTNCFWDNITSGLTTSAGGAGAMERNTTEMQKEATFTGAGWNFTGIWAINEGKTYPYFGTFLNPPQITTSDAVIAIEGILYWIDYEADLPAYPPDNYIDIWSLKTNASGWLSIDSNGILSGTPTNDDLGTFWVNVTMTDIYGGTDSHNFTLTVLNVNSPPMITTPNNTTAIEDMLYTVDYDATDPDPTGDSIFWNYTTNATWLNFNQFTGVLFGWPVNSNVGSYWVNITATDDKGGMSSTNFTLNVINVNGAPDFSPDNVLTAYEDLLYSVDYNATDEEGDTLTWSMTTNSTSFWLGIDTVTGVLSGIPDNYDVGEIWVNITVDDGNGGSVYTNFTLTILNTNDDPVITTTDQPTATEDLLYSVDYEVSDEDIDNVHEWSLSTNANWLNIDDSTGVLSGVPTNADVGSYWVNVQVDDYHLGTDSHNFTLAVQNTNDAPSITTTDIETTVEDDLYSVQYNASDIDPTDDVMAWTLTTSPDWLSIGASSGLLSGTPDNGDVGDHWVNVTVDDGKGGIAGHNFTLTVTNVNDDPVITTTDVTTATAGELYSVDYNATDIDPTNDVFTWSKTGAGWLSIDPSTGLLSGTPSNDNVGTYSIDVTVSDGNGGSDMNSFILTVEPGVVITNLNPDITTTDLITATAGELYTQTYDATDDHTLPADLTWTMSTNAEWLDFDATTRVLSGTPVETDVGIYWVLITVNDGEGGSDSTNFNVTVTTGIENIRPILTAGQISPTSGDTDTSFTFSVHYRDADGDQPESVNVMIDGEIHEMALESGDIAAGTYSYTTKLSEGTHSYYFTASDGMATAQSTDDTPTSIADAESTSSIEEPEKESVTDWTLYLILIIIIVIIIAIIAFAMSRRGGAPLTEESFFIDEEEEIAAEDMASEEDLDEGVAVSEAEGETAEDEEEVEGFECPTCGAVLTETDTKCLECGEEFDD